MHVLGVSQPARLCDVKIDQFLKRFDRVIVRSFCGAMKEIKSINSGGYGRREGTHNEGVLSISLYSGLSFGAIPGSSGTLGCEL